MSNKDDSKEFFVDNQTLVGKIASDKWYAGYKAGQMELRPEINKLERQLKIAIMALEETIDYNWNGKNAFAVNTAIDALKRIQEYNET